jgi:hypothetical protein
MIKIYDNFLTENELSDLYTLIKDNNYELSKVGFNELSDRRTSTQINVSDNINIHNLCKRLI